MILREEYELPDPKYALNVPNFGYVGDVRILAELAREAEASGWDGFFLWDHILNQKGMTDPHVDPWIALTAIALATEHIAIGPMLTPVARRRPWKLAKETTTLDQLSGGRLILGVGLGHEPDFDSFGESRARLKRHVEGIELLRRLWTESDVTFGGDYYTLPEPVTLEPRPVRGTIPIWGGGRHPIEGPFRRAAGYDGVIPIRKVFEPGVNIPPDELDEVRAIIRDARGTLDDYDVALQGSLPEDPNAARAVVEEYGDRITWWLELAHPSLYSLETLRARIRRGPPTTT